jgi:uncharacterized protein YbaA (DUF1428 family)
VRHPRCEDGRDTSFRRSVQIEDGETVVFSWIGFESREHREQVHAEAMKDPRLEEMMSREEMPFDPKRRVYGGFEVAVDV